LAGNYLAFERKAFNHLNILLLKLLIDFEKDAGFLIPDLPKSTAYPVSSIKYPAPNS